MKPLAAAPRALTPMALVAAGVALAFPSVALAGESDVLLAALVLVTALGIPASELEIIREHRWEVMFLSLAPVVVLGAAAWLIGHAFDSATAHGLLAIGLSSSEVASVGLVALAGADATIALGAVTGSLVVAATLGPVAIGWLSGHASHGGTGPLLGRFALVVIAPLIVGVAIRSERRARRLLTRVDPEREGLAALLVALLVYAALSGTSGAGDLGSALAAAVVLLIVSSVAGELWHRHADRPAAAVPGALAIAMRDFAVAAALAAQAFGPRAAAVPGVYGVLMLIAGSIAAGRFARLS